MQIKITSQNISLSKDQEDLIRSKVEKLATYAGKIYDESTEIKVEILHEHSKKPEQAYGCILTIFVPKSTLRAEARMESVRSVVDEAIEKIKSQIEHYKAKLLHMNDKK
jgi:ribosomal subunit interface protein